MGTGDSCPRRHLHAVRPEASADIMIITIVITITIAIIINMIMFMIRHMITSARRRYCGLAGKMIQVEHRILTHVFVH